MRLSGRDWLRTFVLKTNGIWPFRTFNRIPYSAAVRLFVNVVRKRPEIASVYLSHGMAGNEWTPGLSDIDLTLILQGGLDQESEFEFVEWFWSFYDRLKRYFPMLGEVVILDEREFRLWQIYSSTTSHGRRWVLLRGRETASAISIDANHWRPRALNSALWVYLESLVPFLPLPDSYLGRRDIARRARKISRYLEPLVVEDRRQSSNALRDCVETVADIAKLLEDGVQAIGGVTTAETGAKGEIRGVIATPSGRVLMIFEDGLDKSAIRRLIGEHGGAAPIPHCVFSYMLRHYEPFRYAQLAAGRKVLSGADPMLAIDPPERAAIAAYTLDRIAYLLTMTRGEELFSGRKPFSVPSLEYAVRHGLAVVRLLRDGKVEIDPSENAAQIRLSFPEAHDAVEKIRADVAQGREKDARRASFRLLRLIADDIREFAASSDSSYPE